MSISPQADLFPLPQCEMKYYDRVGQEIYVRAIALDDGQRRLALVSYELFGMPFAQALCKRLEESLLRGDDAVILCDTYNHCAPREDLHRFDTSACGAEARLRTDAYFNYCLECGIQAVQRALEGMRPVEIAVHSTHCPVNMNRDQRLRDAWILGKNPEGPSDHLLTAIRLIDQETERPIAILVHYALYGNMCYLAGLEGQASLPVSGDLPGRVCRILEEQAQKPVLWLCGAAGDQDPLMLASIPQWRGDGTCGTRQMSLPEIDAVCEYQAQWIVGCFVQALADEKRMEAAALRTRFASVELPAKNGGKVTVQVGVAKLGSLWLTTTSGAPGALLGEHIRACLPSWNGLLITHAGCFSGYLVDAVHCAQKTFESVQMTVLPGVYEQTVIPLISALVQSILHNE